ncbi:flagellar hook-basal body complex protein FliE [Pelagibacterium montanilacus]|uniref:flagellar hook-basal body complex protein FliE n=1 Tax=Pelagibacterium montanilacus TaxID=2185280 RepID=UPI000F8D832D|nr:flagellar hook-basal body complex protein FliE [Pelagibacterium montanilacus]
MSAPFTSATSAYASAARLISEQASGRATGVGAEAPGGDFAQMLSQQLSNVVETGRASDQVGLDMINGQANIVDVVTALAETEATMETMVTVRDRVISAYEEIMRMPI